MMNVKEFNEKFSKEIYENCKDKEMYHATLWLAYYDYKSDFELGKTDWKIKEFLRPITPDKIETLLS